MSEITQEIENAISTLDCANKIHRLSPNIEKSLYHELISEFVGGIERRWWWEGFSKPYAYKIFTNNEGYKYISSLVTNKNELCWFIVEDSESSIFPIYETTAEYASNIVSQCFAYEYYLVAKDKSWLICENHHGVVFGIGSEIIGAINTIA